MADKTPYHVLRLTSPESKIDGAATTETWEVVARDILANGPGQALRLACESLIAAKSDVKGTYVAVPSRSWKPASIKVETQTVLKVGT